MNRLFSVTILSVAFLTQGGQSPAQDKGLTRHFKADQGTFRVFATTGGKIMAVGVEGKTLHIWDVIAGKLITPIPEAFGDVGNLSPSAGFSVLSPDGSKLVTILHQSIDLWDVARSRRSVISEAELGKRTPPRPFPQMGSSWPRADPEAR